MARYLLLVLEGGGSYRILTMEIGRTPQMESYLELEVRAEDGEGLDRIVENLMAVGCAAQAEHPLELAPSTKDCTVPDGFYSTTNHPTDVLLEKGWSRVASQRMDACIVVQDERAFCVKLRDVRKGQMVAVGHEGIRVHPPTGSAPREGFAFMDREVSSERAVARVVSGLAREMQEIISRKGRIVLVCGPVVIHTGGVEPLSRLIAAGYINALLTGNALGVHDVEHALYGTSLGVDLATIQPVSEGHRNHMRAINAIFKAGSIRAAVDQGVLTTGIFHAAVKAGVPYCLAGSIRDDGPLPDTITDMLEAQQRYAELLEGADMCLMLATMLHAIGSGNMLPSTCRTICVDINPAVVTKLADRGSSQATGVVTDVGLFLGQLARHLST
ncbi:MAG: TIGR00300 family protein [Acidobacteriota bacterium]